MFQVVFGLNGHTVRVHDYVGEGELELVVSALDSTSVILNTEQTKDLIRVLLDRLPTDTHIERSSRNGLVNKFLAKGG